MTLPRPFPPPSALLGATLLAATAWALAQTALASFREDQAKLVLALQKVSASLGG